MQIFQTFGVNIYILIAEIINFLVVLYILNRFLFKPVRRILTKREEEIKRGLENAEKGKKLLEDAEEEAKQTRKKATDEANKIIADAKNEAHEIIAAARVDAKKQTEIMLKDATNDIEQMERQMEKKLFDKVSSVMAEFVKKSTNNLFGQKEQEQLVENAVKEFKKLYE